VRLLAVALLLALPAANSQVAKPSLATPALSPDGREIAFASGGDIWTVPAAGGEARLLIVDPAEESRPLYSHDGTRLAFQSTRTGSNDIYVLTLSTGALERRPVQRDGHARKRIHLGAARISQVRRPR
jgi:Tol biopolymer transport system component